jgi:hypothetical protein
MTQLSLFDDGPQLARQSDPVTSQAAAEEVRPKLHGLREVFLIALAAIGKPATAREIGERAREMALAKEPESVRKRAAELEEKRLISVVEVRRCEYTNKLAETWKIT